MLPNFIVLGAQKAGTTSIFNQLSEHPQVFMPVKEISFFTDEEMYRLGIDRYAAFFDGWNGERAVGEATPNYLASPSAPERIGKHLPDLRMIACLRDPVERAYSAFRMQVFNGAELPDASFPEAVRRVPGYMDNSRYAEQLSRYFRVFPKEQLLVTWFDDLENRPVAFYDAICRFLEIEPIDFSNARIHVSLRGVQPPETLGMLAVRGLRRGFEVVNVGPLRRILNRRLFRRAWHILREALRPRSNVAVGYPPLQPEDRAEVLPLIRDDILRLQEMTGRDLSRWLSPG